MPPRKRLTRETVLAAGLRLATDGGPAALTHRSLAADLDISHPTVVWHVGSREQLLLGVVDLALSEIALPAPEEHPWDDWLRLAASSIRGVILSRPHLAPTVRDLLHQAPAMQEVALAVAEVLQSRLRDAETLRTAYNMYVGWVVGFTGVEVTQLYTEQIDASPLLREAAVSRHAEAYQVLADGSTARVDTATSTSFVEGLEAILTRIQNMADQHGAPSGSP